MSAEGIPRALEGRRVIVTRADPGALADLLASRGAEMLHVPTISISDPADGGRALRRELDRLDGYDWLVVTSPEGARRVAAAASSSPVRLAAVGTSTAAALTAGCGRAVDVVPGDQRASALAEALVGVAGSASRVLVAQADLAGDALADALRAAGLEVVTVVAYRTGVDAATVDPALVAGADAVLFASGSAIRGWVAGLGTVTPAVAIAIGPSTAAVADELGIELTGVAAEHSLAGLVGELETHLRR